MNCPNCYTIMKVVKTKSHYGIPIQLDQCPKCGGLWFEKDELFRTGHEASKIDTLDKNKLEISKPLKKTPLFCPSDGRRLKIFQDRNFPKEIQVESCIHCGSFWLNKGEFIQFQKRRSEQKKEQVKDDKLDQQIDKLLNLHSKKGEYSTLGRLGEFLSTPIDRQTLTPIDYGIKNRSGLNAASILADIIRGVLMIFTKR